MSWYHRVLDGIKSAAYFLNVSQTINLALLVSAILAKRTLNLSELARAYPTPEEQRVERPKHDLLHRLQRLSRFPGNHRVDSIPVQTAFIAHTLPAPKSQNRLEEEALLAVIAALPLGLRPVILADRGFARANFFALLKSHHLAPIAILCACC